MSCAYRWRMWRKNAANPCSHHVVCSPSLSVNIHRDIELTRLSSGAAVPGSRQGCFKCGNRESRMRTCICIVRCSSRHPVGHIAENCQAPGRLCYNCRESGHESTACPQPRSTDGKQCYACGGVGHVKADCPSVRGPAGPGGFGAAAGAQKCYQCGRFGVSRQKSLDTIPTAES